MPLTENTPPGLQTVQDVVDVLKLLLPTDLKAAVDPVYADGNYGLVVIDGILTYRFWFRTDQKTWEGEVRNNVADPPGQYDPAPDSGVPIDAPPSDVADWIMQAVGVE